MIITLCDRAKQTNNYGFSKKIANCYHTRLVLGRGVVVMCCLMTGGVPVLDRVFKIVVYCDSVYK